MAKSVTQSPDVRERIKAIIEHLNRQGAATASKLWDSVELTMPQFKMLVLLHRDGAMTLTALSAKMGVTLPAASTRVDRLVKDGWIARAEDPDDRRRVQLSLTRRANTRLEQLEGEFTAQLMRALSRMSPEGLLALEQGMMELLSVSREMFEEKKKTGTTARRRRSAEDDATA